MFNKYYILSLLSLTSVFCEDPITFKGGDVAVSKTIEGKVTLYANAKSGQNDASQFLYDKNEKDAKKVDLAEVYLYSGNKKVASLQSNFDMIAQTCSCYWVKADDLVKRFPSLTNGDYYFVMDNGSNKVKSGIFSLVTGKESDNSKDPEKISDKEDESSKSKQSDKEETEKSKENSDSSTKKSATSTKESATKSEASSSTKTFEKNSSNTKDSSSKASTTSSTSNSLIISPYAVIALGALSLHLL